AGQRSRVAENFLSLSEWLSMSEQYAFDLAQRRDGNPIKNVIPIFQQNFSDTDQRRIEFIALKHLCQLRRRRENDFPFDAASERHCVEVSNRPDAKRSQRLFKVAFSLQLRRALLALEPMTHFLDRLARSHA